MINEGDPGVYTSCADAITNDPNQQLLNIGRDIMKARGCSWSEAWNLALDQNPDLKAKTLWSKFLYIPRPSGRIDVVPPAQEKPVTSAPGYGGQAAKARAQACAQVVRAVQTANPGLSFEDSWRIAEAENKQLFQP